MDTLQNYQSLEAYRSHELTIQMRTSSGDTINMGLSSTQQLTMEQSQTEGAASKRFSFASMHAYQFSMDSNGLDDQDKQEIQAFMQIAQPYIDGFMQELESGEQHTPMSQVARSIGDIFAPLNERSEDSRNFAKNGIVKMMDNALQQLKDHGALIDESQTFLDKILQHMNSFDSMLYA